MWKEKLLTLYPSLRSNILPLSIGFIGLILLSYGLISSLTTSSPDEDITFESSRESPESSGSEAKIIVDVQGAVVTPGVYTLSVNTRVKDALIAASGLSSDADREWVAKNLNQAGKLTDGAKIYIPRVGEAVSAGSTSSFGTVSTSNLININSASSTELESLPGIGPVTANKIIDNRPYSSVEELRTKKVVGQSIFEKIKDKISIY